METGKIHKSMITIMRNTAAITKDQTNKQQGFKYRGIDDVYNALHDLLAKEGIYCTSKILDRVREERQSKGGGNLIYTCLHVEYTYWAEDGSCVTSAVWGEGMDSGDKSSNKALAVAHKYSLLQTFLIPTDDIIDPDSQAHEVKREKVSFTDYEKKQVKNLIEYWKAVYVDPKNATEAFKEETGLSQWKDLTPEIFKKMWTKYSKDINDFNNAGSKK